MKHYYFNDSSMKKLSTCHPDLILIMNAAINITEVDFGIAEGHRSIERQKELFADKKSKIDGVNKLSKHNHEPSMAVDIYPVVNGRVDYSLHTCCYLAGVIQAASNYLDLNLRLSHIVRWGGNWDQDGELITDQKFQDLVHFELVRS